MTAAEVAQINDLVKEAMGFSKERGDTLNVTNAPFDGVDKPVEAPAALAWWRDPEIQEMARQYGKYLLAAIVLLFLYFRLLRPMMRPVLRKFDEITELPPAPAKPTVEDGRGRSRARRAGSGGPIAAGSRLPRKFEHGEKAGPRRSARGGQRRQGMGRRK